LAGMLMGTISSQIIYMAERKISFIKSEHLGKTNE